MGAVPQLFRNHLVPFKQTEGIVIFVLIDKYIHSRDITEDMFSLCKTDAMPSFFKAP